MRRVEFETGGNPSIFWVVWDAFWLVFESFMAGRALSDQEWLTLTLAIVFTVMFLAMMVLHLKTMTWTIIRVTKEVDGDETISQDSRG